MFAVTRSGTLHFAQKSPLSPDNAPNLGALLNFLFCCSPRSLGFLPHAQAVGRPGLCPIGHVLVDLSLPSPEQQNPQERPKRGTNLQVQAELLSPLALGFEPWGRDTVVSTVVLEPPLLALQQPVVKLTWLEDDHFVGDETNRSDVSIEELILTELDDTLSNDKPLLPASGTDEKQLTKAELRERVPSLKACKIFRNQERFAKSGKKTAVLYLMDGQGERLTKNTFPTIGDLMVFLQELWKSVLKSSCCKRAEMITVCAAYYTLWRAGVAHRDLSTSNVMIRNGKPFLIDFGGSTFLDGTTLEPRAGAAHRQGPLIVSLLS